MRGKRARVLRKVVRDLADKNGLTPEEEKFLNRKFKQAYKMEKEAENYGIHFLRDHGVGLGQRQENETKEKDND